MPETEHWRNSLDRELSEVEGTAMDVLSKGMQIQFKRMLDFAKDPEKLARLRSIDPEVADNVEALVTEVNKLKQSPEQLAELREDDPAMADFVEKY